MQSYKEYYSALNEQLSGQIQSLAITLLGKPVAQSTSIWRFGLNRELMVTIAGENMGRFWNFETGEGGSALDLIAKTKNVSGRDLCQWAQSWLGQGHRQDYSTSGQSQNWTPVFPVPASAPEPDFTKAPLSSMFNGRTLEARYAYCDEYGSLLGYVVRLKDPAVGKVVPVLTYCRNESGQQGWRWKGFGTPRPAYGLELLSKNPTATILIVEGEKTANVARLLFPHLCVLTWSGGVACVLKTDWRFLKGRSVIIWPDNDAVGKKAAEKLRDHLRELGPDAQIIDVPETLPIGWDLADGAEKADILKATNSCSCFWGGQR